MEILTIILEAIATFGFPIVCCLVLGWFVFKIYQDTTKQNAENMMKQLKKEILKFHKNQMRYQNKKEE